MLSPHRENSDVFPWKKLSFIFAITFFAYANIFLNGFILDDHDYVENWPLIRDWQNLPRFFWKYVPPEGQEGVFSPLKTLFHAVNYHLFGLNPIGYHLVALANYFLIVYFVYRIAVVLIRQSRAAFIATLLFALHPVHIEYVASITGSVDAIGITFLFLALWFYVRSYDNGKSIGRRYAFALLFSFLAIFTHELLLALPFLFLWYDFCFYRKQIPPGKIILRSVPFFIVGGIYVLLKLVILGSVTRGGYLFDSPALTMFVIIKALAKYVLISFFPVTLTHNHVISPGIYSFGPDDFDRVAVFLQSWFEPQVLASLALLAGIGYFSFTRFKREPFVTFCVGWFFIALIPVMNIVPSAIYFAERYLFVGSMGFCLLAAYYLEKLAGTALLWRQRGITIFLVLVSVLFVVRISTRNADYRNDVTILESAVRANSKSALMRTDLALAYLSDGQLDKALASLQEAQRLRPDDPEIYFILADVYTAKRMFGKAVDHLETAIDLKSDYVEAYYNLAGIYAYWARADFAEQYLGQAVELWRRQGERQKADEMAQNLRDYLKKRLVEAESFHD